MSSQTIAKELSGELEARLDPGVILKKQNLMAFKARGPSETTWASVEIQRGRDVGTESCGTSALVIGQKENQ